MRAPIAWRYDLRVLRRLTLTRFRGFADFSADLGEVTAVIGRNSSGKTSLLQATRLACEATRYVLQLEEVAPRVQDDAIHVCGKQEVVVGDAAALVGLVDWTQLITDGAVGDGVRSQLSLEFDAGDPIQQLTVELVYGRNAQLKLWIVVKSDRIAETVAGMSPQSQQRAPRLREELRRWLPVAIFVPPFYGVIRTEEYRPRPIVDRALASGDQSHIVRNLLARLKGPQIGGVNQLLKRTIAGGAEVTDWTHEGVVDSVASLAVRYRDSNGQLELSTAGAGLVSLIALGASLEWTRPSVTDGQAPTRIFLFDEPEAHLHPRLQGEIGVQIAAEAKGYGAQVVLATHSVEMVNRLGRQPETVLLHVERASRHAVRLTSDNEVLRALDEFCDLTPYSSINFLASRRVVFHEGPSDWKILEACANAYFENNDVKLAAWRRYVPIPLDGVGNVSMPGVLNKLLSPGLFPVASSGSPVQAVLIIDRDMSRTPGMKTTKAPGSNVEGREQVWSRNSIESLFLDPAILREWLAAFLPTDVPNLATILDQARQIADGNTDLNADAVRLLVAARLRPSSKPTGDLTYQEEEKAAHRDALAAVTSEPWVWQKGRERSRVMLREVKNGLPPSLGGSFPVDLARIIEETQRPRLRNATDAIPLEIRQLLDSMV